MNLTEEERKEATDYLKLSQEEREKYLEENGVVILDLEDEDDGRVRMELDMKTEYHVMLQSNCKDGETIDSVFSRMLTEFVDSVKNEKK
jgi:hypothetical protein